jgi:very-short-patch-repair endonuclease
MNRKDKAASDAENARRLRREQSPAEGVLWGFLRAHRLGGFKFRRQVAMGPWVADFYCADASLVVELDGASHRGDRKATDARKDAWMQERRIFVLRITASELSKNPDGIRRTILRICRERARLDDSSRAPGGLGGEEKG